MRLVPVKHLREDSYIAINVINNDGKLLLKGGQKISSRGIETLMNVGVSYVYIRDEYCFNNDSPKYMTNIDEIYHVIGKLRDIANKIIVGKANRNDLLTATSIAEQIVTNMLLVKDDFKITYEPSKLVVNSIVEQTIYVAIMSTALGVKMDLSKEQLVKLCLSALLKDTALISPNMNHGSQIAYKAHPAIGYAYLKKTYNIDEEILQGVLQHHERSDGSGFPNRLKDAEICEFAKIISIIECFYELKSDHALLERSHGVFEGTLKKLLKSFNVRILGYFLKNAEVFTLDTLVRLNNEDLAVIIKNGIDNPFKPTIKIIRSKQFSEGTVLDLQKHKELSIRNIEYYVSNPKKS